MHSLHHDHIHKDSYAHPQSTSESMRVTHISGPPSARTWDLPSSYLRQLVAAGEATKHGLQQGLQVRLEHLLPNAAGNLGQALP